MKSKFFVVCSVVVALAFMANARAEAVEVVVKGQANQGNANIGDTGYFVTTSALVQFVVSDLGVPVSTFPASYGNGSAPVVQPTGISVTTASVPAGGCGVSVTEWGNQGNGTYFFRLSPPPSPGCAWREGAYTFRLIVNTPGYQGMDLVRLDLK